MGGGLKIGFAFVGFSFIATSAMAQQSTAVGALTASQGVSAAGIASSIESMVLNGSVRNSSSGDGQNGDGDGEGGSGDQSANSGGAVVPSAFATGRLQRTSHDGYVSPTHDPARTYAFDTYESSLFGSMMMRLPRVIPGGLFQVGAFGGYAQLNMDLHPVLGSNDQRDPGRANNKATMIGGYALAAKHRNYAMITIAGAFGKTTLEDDVNRYKTSYDTRGILVSGLAGRIIPLTRFGNGRLNLDVRTGLTWLAFEGDTFLTARRGVLNDNSIDTEMDAVISATSLSLFATVRNGGMIVRPYAKATLKHDLLFESRTQRFRVSTGALRNDDVFGRHETAGNAEIGLTAVEGNTTFSAAAFAEHAADRNLFGGRVGVRFKLN